MTDPFDEDTGIPSMWEIWLTELALNRSRKRKMVVIKDDTE